MTAPEFPTMVRRRFADGRMLNIDGNSMWLYRRVPMGAVEDAKTPEDAIRTGGPIMAAMDMLADMPSIRSKRRRGAKGAYREVHLLWVNVPTAYTPPPGPLAPHLAAKFHGTAVMDRVLLFGVRLNATVGTGGFRAALDSVTETIVSGGTPLEDYDRDFNAVDQVLARAGLVTLSQDGYRLANAWWNPASAPDIPYMPHADHMHFFRTADAGARATRAGLETCDDWPDFPDAHEITFATVEDVSLEFVEHTKPASKWFLPFVEMGAIVASIRGTLEPPQVTRAELRHQRKEYLRDISKAMNDGLLSRDEHDAKLGQLTSVEGIYSENRAPATLVNGSIIVGFNGHVESVEDLSTEEVTLNSMMWRQPGAWAETMIASSARANPHAVELPSVSFGISGLASLSTVGDRSGALVGFTEKDRQPAYLSPSAASTADGLPICLVAGATGSGKSLLMLSLADQFARNNNPNVVIDPKPQSDHSAAVLLSGGQVASLDDMVTGDGILDPLRFAQNRASAVQAASSMLMLVNPWGGDRDRYEVDLLASLEFGAQNGATCTGQALRMAEEAGVAPTEMVAAVMKLANSFPMFRACFGVNPGTNALRFADGITLIKVGSTNLELPKPGQQASSLTQRVSVAVVRMMVFGSMMALTGRGGVLHLDEAWVVLDSTPDEVERVGRLARSQNVLPILYTQRVTDAVRAGLAGYISRGLIGPIKDPEEAAAACELFKLEPTAERISRITAPARLSGTGDDEDGELNWASMRALVERGADGTVDVKRGAIFTYIDLADRAIPTEVTLPNDFLTAASTNPDDVRRRMMEREAMVAR